MAQLGEYGTWFVKPSAGGRSMCMILRLLHCTNCCFLVAATTSVDCWLLSVRILLYLSLPSYAGPTVEAHRNSFEVFRLLLCIAQGSRYLNSATANATTWCQCQAGGTQQANCAPCFSLVHWWQRLAHPIREGNLLLEARFVLSHAPALPRTSFS